ncbi:MAG: S8 family serine peptidase [Calditrichaeota bacterium]|nr:S8 family serine peptidase [Calditrichota bacterium]
MRKALTGIALLSALAGSAIAGSFTSGLELYVANKSDSENITVLLTLAEQAPVADLDRKLHDAKATRAERHLQVVTALQSTAARTQLDLRNELDLLRAQGKVNGYTPYWIVNGIVVNAPIAVVRELAARADVESADVNLVVENIAALRTPKDRIPPNDPGRTITSGLAAIRADEVWNTLGTNGSGALIGGIDTGVDGTHPALASRWRGNNGHPTSECWLDAAGLGHTLPTDTNNHGTHTMGTMVGGNDIGVAPGAQWIASNCINMGTGVAFDNAVIASFQFMTDPDNNPGTIDDAPDVVQNSWGVNENFSGYVNCDTRWWAVIDNTEIAGVCVTFSAGNEGSGASTLRSPADRCVTPYSCFSVGATDPANGNIIASFSSRGPSTCSPAPYPIKPEVSAPGVNTYSSIPGGGYDYYSGTSMAGPHVAGVVALMRAANPDVEVNTIKQILMDTAVDLGTVGEDNNYGWGQIDAYEAVLAVMTGFGSVDGTVTSSVSGLPLDGASISNTAGAQSSTTNASGDYAMNLAAGNYTLEYSQFGYVTTTRTLDVFENATTTQNVALVPAPSALLYGYVYDPSNSPVPNATISFTNHDLPGTTTDVNGYYSTSIPLGFDYDLTAYASGLGGQSRSVTFNASQQLDFHLPLYEGFESGNFSAYNWSQSGTAPWVIVTSPVYEGSYAAKSGTITHNQNSTMTLSLTIAAAGEIAFRYKVSSESNYDFLRFYIDGAQQTQWSGEIDWTQSTYPVSAGNHTFTWTYSKDVSVNTGSDCAWVDEIIPPSSLYPNITVDPLSLAKTLAAGTTGSDLVTLGNTGDGNLDWTASVSIAGLASSVPYMELRKGGADPRQGVAGRAAGGPDAWGYSWADSNEPGGPTYDWFDISSIGTAAADGDDILNGPFALGFNFSFYGNDYSDVSVCSNGFLSFTGSDASWTNQGIPNAAVPNNMIAPFWDDMNPLAGGTVYYYADAANSRFIAQWQGVYHYNTTTPETFQAILNADGSIVYQYQTVNSAASCTVGIENLDGSDGLQVVFNAAYLTSGMAIRLSSAPPVTPWLSISPLSGTVNPSGSGVVTVSYDATDLLDGVYNGTVVISSNDTNTPTVNIPVVLTVGPVSLDPVVLSIQHVSGTTSQLSWTPSVGATSYDIYHATALGSPYTLLANTTNTSYNVTGLTNDVRLFQVIARN